MTENLSTAVLLPCFNEAGVIKDVVESYRAAIPEAVIYVYDNNSTDGTADIAAKAGAVVRNESNQGKGAVVRRMFADIDADIYIMADGDGTYDAKAAPQLIKVLREQFADMITGVRKKKGESAYRRGHEFGNRIITGTVKLIFGRNTKDMLSGYRVFSRRFVKSFPADSTGFEIETELTVHALELSLPMVDVETDYFDRSGNTESKLSTFRDGFRIGLKILALFKHHRPLTLFGLVTIILVLGAAGLLTPIFIDYFQTGEVPRFPTLISAIGLGILACLSATCGLILDTISKGFRNNRRLAYLSIAPRHGLDAG